MVGHDDNKPEEVYHLGAPTTVVAAVTVFVNVAGLLMASL